MAIARSTLTSKNERTTDNTITTASFTPSNNSLLLVIATAICPQGFSSGSESISDSAGLTWTKRKVQSSGGTPPGDWPTVIYIWTAPVTTGVSMTVTHGYGAVSTDGNGNQDILVQQITGHDVANPVVQVFGDGAPGSSYRDTTATVYEGTLGATTAADSLLFGVVSVDYDNPDQFTTYESYEHTPVWTRIAQFVDGPYNTSLTEYTTGTATNLMRCYFRAQWSWTTAAIEIRAAGSGDQAVTAARYTGSDSFGTGSVAATYGITATRLADADAFAVATLSASNQVTAGAYSDADTFHAATVSLQQDQAVLGTLFANGNVFHGAAVGGAVTVRGGDDAPRRRVPAYVPEIPDEEPEPEKPAQKRRVTRKAVRKALESVEIPEIFKPTVRAAQAWLPPAIEALDEAEFETELAKLVHEKALRDAEDEDDAEFLLWNA